MMAVFARQFLGWAYQPPAGDQTCLGYLLVAMSSAIEPRKVVVSDSLHVRDLGAAAHECLCGLHCCVVVYCVGICQSPSCIALVGGGEVAGSRCGRGSVGLFGASVWRARARASVVCCEAREFDRAGPLAERERTTAARLATHPPPSRSFACDDTHYRLSQRQLTSRARSRCV